MDPGDDIIDVLYRCREPSQPPGEESGFQKQNTSPYQQLNCDGTPGGPYREQQRTNSSHTVFAITPNTGLYSGTPSLDKRRPSKVSAATTGQDSSWSTPGTGGRQGSSPYSSTPALGRYNGTGRVGYNNTPQIQRRSSFSKPLVNKFSPLPRSASAFDYRTPTTHHRTPPAQRLRDYDGYESHHEGDYGAEEEPVYIPRSTMVDLIKKDDEFLINRLRGEEVIELPSGARQRKRRIFGSEGVKMSSDGCELRSRRSIRRDGTIQQQKKSFTPSYELPEQGALSSLLEGANKVVGLLVMLYLSYRYSLYLYHLHDNELWFSEITELEREISFRTEQGLYYSYFKQLVQAPTLADGIKQLQTDNETESVNTINIFHRFNIHQELALAGIYKVYSFRLSPIFFYTYFVFFLQGIYLSALYLISWSLTGTWLTGVLTSVYVVVNRFDVTRVTFTVPLREHFSLPFIFSQFGCVGHYLRTKTSSRDSDNLQLAAVFLTGLIFTLTWQFAQFVLLLQALVIFGLATVGLLDRDKVCRLLTVDLLVMLTVWYLQFYQPMVLNSLVVSLVPVAILSLQSQSDTSHQGVLKNICLSAARLVIGILVTVCLNLILKMLMNQTSDSHIFKFLINKLSNDSTDFETQLYLCNEAFKWLDLSTYQRLTASSALPAYIIFTIMCLSTFCIHLYRHWRIPDVQTPAKSSLTNGSIPNMRSKTSYMTPTDHQKLEPEKKIIDVFDHLIHRPDLTYHIGQSLPLCVLAASTLRMKCFWSPYVCLLASCALSDPVIWSTVVSKVSGAPNQRVMNLFRHLLLTFVIFLLASQQKPIIDKEMEDLREFYDPDTVDLMQWIQQNTQKDDVISGSMQLLAGVKLCTGRTLTNHPHFEDKALRDRTKELYQMYAKTSPEAVFNILAGYNASYIILEDSICLAHRERCSLPDIMDLTNGHVPDDGIREPQTLVQSKFPRFCVEVRYDSEEYRKWFRKVFENKTFRIYKLLHDKTK